MFTKFALIPQLHKGKSFNGHATVWVDTYGGTTLRLDSYQTSVCKVCIDSKTQSAEAFIPCDEFDDGFVNTKTTRKHVKEFLWQCFSYHFIEHFDEIMKEFNKQSEYIKVKTFSDFLKCIAEVSCDYLEGRIVYLLKDYRGNIAKVTLENTDD